MVNVQAKVPEVEGKGSVLMTNRDGIIYNKYVFCYLLSREQSDNILQLYFGRLKRS